MNATQNTFRLRGVNGEIEITTKFVGDEERQVLELLQVYGKLQIGQIVGAIKNLGSHEQHEHPRKKTTTRKVYQIVRNLREAGYPIVGDSKGIWIAESIGDVETFAYHLEQKARSDIRSMLHLKRTMLAIVHSNTPSLFDAVKLDEEAPAYAPQP